ncbi:hypothetical protein ACE7GA_22585 [Roseomonas sp. CCTCC AB2023176]|uniref:hypothetical protein n=1 Tax=Roseomonas sp. CCTCC AB2023176 TaxID=3342640 RepID=UPI0035D88B30
MRLLILACAAVGLTLPAVAQARDCKADGTLVVESVTTGTQRVSRDPRSGQGDWITYSATVRNASANPVVFTASFPFRGLQQNFLTGQSWAVQPGSRAYLTIGNTLPPAIPESSARDLLNLTCG